MMSAKTMLFKRVTSDYISLRTPALYNGMNKYNTTNYIPYYRRSACFRGEMIERRSDGGLRQGTMKTTTVERSLERSLAFKQDFKVVSCPIFVF